MDRIRQSSIDRYREKQRENQKFYLPELKKKSEFDNPSKYRSKNHLSSFYNKTNKKINFIGFSSKREKKLNFLNSKKIDKKKKKKSNELRKINLDFISTTTFTPKSVKKKLFCLSKHFRNKKML